MVKKLTVPKKKKKLDQSQFFTAFLHDLKHKQFQIIKIQQYNVQHI